MPRSVENPAISLVERLWRIKRTIKQLTAEQVGTEEEPGVEPQLVAYMKERSCKTLIVPAKEGDQHEPLKATLIERHSLEIDWEMIANEIGPSLWKRIQSSQPDKKLLEAEMAMGNISRELVDRATSVVPNKPYVRIDEHRGAIPTVREQVKAKPLTINTRSRSYKRRASK